MRKFVYITAFLLLFVGNWLPTFLQTSNARHFAISFAGQFRPIPGSLSMYLPKEISIPLLAIVGSIYGALFLRRIWLCILSRSILTPSFGIFPYIFLSIGTYSAVLGIIAMIATILLRAGSGVPAALLMIPAMYLLAPTFLWIEFRSLIDASREKK